MAVGAPPGTPETLGIGAAGTTDISERRSSSSTRGVVASATMSLRRADVQDNEATGPQLPTRWVSFRLMMMISGCRPARHQVRSGLNDLIRDSPHLPAGP